jgi:hypothetical protein
MHDDAELEQPVTPDAPPPAPTVPAEPPGRALAWAIGAALAYLAFYVLVTLFNQHPFKLPLAGWVGASVVTTVGYVVLLLFTVRQFCRLTLSARQETGLLFLALALFLGLNPMTWKIVDQLLHGKPLGDILVTVTKPDFPPLFAIIVPFFLILTGIFAGRLLSRIIKDRAMLVPVALVAGLIDFWGVYWGFVSQMSEKAGDAVSGMASATTAATAVPDEVKAQVPQSLSFLVNLTPPEMIGLGDFVFLAFFVMCAVRFGFSTRRTVGGIIVGMLLASFIMALDGTTFLGHDISISYLPGLLFICGGVLLANLPAWRLTRDEWAITGVLVAILAVGIGVSIYQDEAGKSHTRSLTYTLTAVPPAGMLRHAFDRIAKGKDAPDHTRLAYVTVTYLPNGSTPVPVQWMCVALGTQQRVTPRNSREYVVVGKAATPNLPVKSWAVEQTVTIPPSMLPGFYRQVWPTKKAVTDVELLKTAPEIPAAALTALDHPEQYAALVKPKVAYQVILTPKDLLVAQNGQVVKRVGLRSTNVPEGH